MLRSRLTRLRIPSGFYEREMGTTASDAELSRELLRVAVYFRDTRDEDLCTSRVLFAWMFGNLEYTGLDKVVNRVSLFRGRNVPRDLIVELVLAFMPNLIVACPRH